MKIMFLSTALLAGILAASCATNDADAGRPDHYGSQGRFTDPGELSTMLAELPDEATGIAEVAKQLTVHHNLLPYFGVPKSRWEEMNRIWPPKLPDILAALNETGPRNLYDERKLEDRVVGACMLESHLLAGMLRHKEIPARIRAGYFKDVQENESHVVEFWENTLRARGANEELLREDPEKWREEINAYTRQQIEINHYIEHWVTEYWDDERREWRILDANNTFLKASGDLDVGYMLPRKHFEYASEAWRKMRSETDFNPDRYSEWPQDGRSHIRSQLLWDFFSLLNHDIAGYDKTSWPSDDTTTEERDAYAFIKEKKYEDLSPEELEELDALAGLLERDAGRDELVEFYRRSRTIELRTAESDRYSFLSNR